MNKSNTQKVLYTLLVVYILSLVALFIFNLIDINLFKNDEIIEIFRIGIALDKALDFYLENFIAIHTAGIIILYSIFFKPEIMKTTVDRFSKLISSSIITFSVLSLIYLILIILIAPSVKSSLQGKINLNNTAVFFLNTAQENYEKENYEQAVKYFDLYLSIDNNNRDIHTIKQFTEEKIGKPVVVDNTISEDKEVTEVDIEETAESFALLNKAKDFFEQKDYASAHYYAKIVYDLNPGNNAAKILLEEALAQLYTFKPADSNPEYYLYKDEDYSLYELKVKGYSALQSENYIEAYLIFEILTEASPDNKEINDFFIKSREGLKTFSFFYSEIEEINTMPDINNIIFLNNHEDTKEIILIGHMYHIGPQIYFKNIDVIRLNNAGNIIFSIFSEYGKYINNFINLNYIKEDDQIVFDEDKMIELNININLLPYFSIEKNTINTINLNDLFSVRDLYDDAGYNKKNIELEFFIKIIHPCLFLILSLLSISIGWAYRARYLGRPPIITYIIMPIMPFVNAIIISLIIYFHKILIGYILVTSGFIITLISLIIIEFILFVIALIILSGQRME